MEQARRRPAMVRALILLLSAVSALAVSALVSLAFGSEPLHVSGVIRAVTARLGTGVVSDPIYDTIVWDIRLPRALMGVVVGAGLGVAGCLVQTLVRNPLADPYLLGVAAGASVGATGVIVLGVFSGLGIWALSTGAFAGALVAAAAVLGVSLMQGGLSPLRLILTGVVMSSAFSSLASFLVFLSDDPQSTQSVLFWLLGSLSGASWPQLWLPLAVVVLAGTCLFTLHNWLDALAAGDDAARSLGVPVAGLRFGLFVLASLLVAVMVAVAGGIGFVGLVIPHLARLLVGGRHRWVLPASALGGALFLLWVDVLARLAVRPQEIPLGVVTGLVGAPLFLVLLGRRHYSFGGER